MERVFGGVFWTKGSNINPKVAVLLSPATNYAILKDFSFWIKKEGQAPKSAVLTPLLVSLYEVSSTNNLPGELISNAPIIYFPKKSGKQTIKLDTLQIRIP